jgi:hypothetical protein
LLSSVNSFEEVVCLILSFKRQENKDLFLLNVEYIQNANACLITISSREDIVSFKNFCAKQNKTVKYVGFCFIYAYVISIL